MPPSFEELAAWAGEGRVVRADPAAITNWRLPEHQKAALINTGIPLIGEGILSAVTFHDVALDDGRQAYQLAMNVDDTWPSLTKVFSAEPVSGAVWETRSGPHRLVNSSIPAWQRSLHLVGLWLATSTTIGRWDEDRDAEDAALAELAGLRDRIREFDPASYGKEGHHATHYWPGVLDRWLY